MPDLNEYRLVVKSVPKPPKRRKVDDPDLEDPKAQVAPVEPPDDDDPPLEAPEDAPTDEGMSDADAVEGHEWAGDRYEEGDETDPAESFAAFTGQSGEDAWLDRSEDGTLTGWVRDADGTVYRYSDHDAWAADVDDAGMTRTGGEPTDPAADEAAPAAEGDAAAGGGVSLFDGVTGKSFPVARPATVLVARSL